MASENSLTKLPAEAQSRSPPLAPDPGSLDCFLAMSSNLPPFFQAGQDGLGLFFLFHQDVAGAVLLAPIGRHEFVVFGLDVGIGHRVVFLEIRKQLTNQDGLSGQFQLATVVLGGIQATLGCFLHEDFAGNDFFLDLGFNVRGDGTTRAHQLLSQGVSACLGNGFAIHDGQIL